jgi:hypothetical protein
MSNLKDMTFEDFMIEMEDVEGDPIRSILMEQASDTAEKLCELECKLNNIKCYVVEMEGDVEVSSYTEEAQDIFNIYYDEQMDELYRVLYKVHIELEK